MSRRRAVAALVYASSIVFLVLVLRLFRVSGPPYFAPATIVDHSGLEPNRSRQVIEIQRQIEQLVPRGSTITFIESAENLDAGPFLTASGFLPHHLVQGPNLDDPSLQYVVTLARPLEHPSYRLVTPVGEGWLYARNE